MKLHKILILAAFLNVTSQSQWITISVNYDSYSYYTDVFFINGETGFIAGDKNSVNGILLKTTNGGLHWDTNYVNYGQRKAVFFTDQNTGYSCGFNPFILKTTNQGFNWVIQYSPIYNIVLEDIDFVDSLTGYMSGVESGVVIKTINGGVNWHVILGGGYPYEDLYDIDFPSKDTGYVIWKDRLYNYVTKTTNGGRYPWVDFRNQGPTYRSLSFCNNTTGWVVSSSFVYKTTIGSFRYSNEYTVTPLITGAMDILALNCDTVYIAGANGRIFKSTNGGLNWVYFQTSVNSTLVSINFIGTDTGFVVGSNGAILKTTNGGGNAIGINIVSLEVPTEFSLYQNYPNPFNPVTKIRINIPLSRGVSEGRGVLTSLIIYDILGREVATLVNEQVKPGTYEVEWDAEKFTSGIYFYRLESGDYSESRKMILLK